MGALIAAIELGKGRELECYIFDIGRRRGY